MKKQAEKYGHRKSLKSVAINRLLPAAQKTNNPGREETKRRNSQLVSANRCDLLLAEREGKDRTGDPVDHLPGYATGD